MLSGGFPHSVQDTHKGTNTERLKEFDIARAEVGASEAMRLGT